MPVYKINFFFEYTRYGWSETYYADYANPNTAMTAALNLLPLRTALLGWDALLEGPKLTKVRISDVARQRDSILYAVPDADKFGFGGGGPGDFPSTCMLIRAEAGPDYRRSIYLRGQPDVMVIAGRINRDAGWMGRFNAFRALLTDRPWGILAIDRPDATISITTITSTTPPLVTVTTAADHGLSIGNTVRVIAAPGTTGVRGNRIVATVPDNRSFTYVGLLAGVYRGGGTLYKRVPTLKQFTRLELLDVAKRDTGSPSGGPVGRRPRRVAV